MQWKHLAGGTDPFLEISLIEGAVYKVPAGIWRISKCFSTVACSTFLYQDGKLDVVPVDK